MTKLIRYEELELIVKADWINTSFDHTFGIKHQGFYEVTEVEYNGVVIPIGIISEDTLKYLDDEVNK